MLTSTGTACGAGTGTITGVNGTAPISVVTNSGVASASVSNATTGALGVIQLAGDLGNTATVPEVVSTHLTSALPIAQGGTGASSTSQSFVFAGPISGSGAPTFRALAAGDLPSLASSYIQNGTTAQTGANFNIGGNGTIGGTLHVTGAVTGASFSGTGTSLTALSAGNISSGTLAVAYGGTGSTTGSITGTGALTFAAGGTNSGITLTPTGTGTVTVPSLTGTGALTIAAGGTNQNLTLSPSGSGNVVLNPSTGKVTVPTLTINGSAGAAPTAAGTISYNTTNNTYVGGNGTSTVTFGTLSGGVLPASEGGTGVANSATLTLGTSNVNLASLGSGLVYNTTTTGALTDATAAQVVAVIGSTAVTNATTATTAATATNVLFSGITASTNTSAAMVVGSGASLAATGTGTITATGLATTGSAVVVSSAGAPTTGQVLTATSGTAASWQTPTTTSGRKRLHPVAVRWHGHLQWLGRVDQLDGRFWRLNHELQRNVPELDVWWHHYVCVLLNELREQHGKHVQQHDPTGRDHHDRDLHVRQQFDKWRRRLHRDAV